MSTLSGTQYMLVYNVFSFTIAAMFAAFIFFIVGRSQVGPKYRPALLVSSLVVAIACYHYFRIFNSFEGAYALTDGSYTPTGTPFNDAYRYVDWLLTVPLLLVELVSVLGLPKSKSGQLLSKLSLAAVLMIVTGYPGEISSDISTRAIWGAISTVPFVYILYVLWVQLGQVMTGQSAEVNKLFQNIRLLLLATWGFYPITYLLPQLGVSADSAVVGIQIGYAIADVLAKAGYGVMIYAIARTKSAEDGTLPDLQAA